MAETINKIRKAVKNMFSGSGLPGIEFYPQKKIIEPEFEQFIIDEYIKADKAVQVRLDTWESNRAAYMAETYDRFGNWATFKDARGKKLYYSSDRSADKLNDLVSMMLKGGVRAFPLPNVNEQSEFFQMLITQGGFDVQQARKYVRKIWDISFDDVRKLTNMTRADIKVILDAMLCEYGVTKQIAVYNQRTQQIEAAVMNILPEHYLTDTASETMEGRYEWEKSFRPPHELIQLHPDNKQDILDAVIDKRAVSSPRYKTRFVTERAEEIHANMDGMVLYCTGYFKDDAIEKKKDSRQVFNEDIGDFETEEFNEEVRLFPKGRVVTYLPDTSKVITDKANIFNGPPFAVYQVFPVTFSRFGKNLSSPLTAIQAMDDQVVQQGLANLKAVGNHIVAYTEGTDVEQLSNRIATKIKVGDARDLTITKATSIGVDMNNFHTQISQDSNRISGVEDVDEGRATGQLSSGKAIDSLIGSTTRKMQPRNALFVSFKMNQGQQIADIMLQTHRAGRLLNSQDRDGLPQKLPVDLFEITESITMGVDNDNKMPVNPTNLLPILLQMVPMIMQMPLIGEVFLDLIPSEIAGDIKSKLQEAIQQQQQTLQAQQQEGGGGQGGATVGTPAAVPG